MRRTRRIIAASAGLALCLHLSYVRQVTAVPVVAPSGIVGWWPGDGSAIDIVNANNGTVGGGADFSSGEVDQGFHFPGTGIVSVPDSNALDLSRLTMEAWISLEAPPGDYFTIATKGIA